MVRPVRCLHRGCYKWMMLLTLLLCVAVYEVLIREPCLICDTIPVASESTRLLYTDTPSYSRYENLSETLLIKDLTTQTPNTSERPEDDDGGIKEKVEESVKEKTKQEVIGKVNDKVEEKMKQGAQVEVKAGKVMDADTEERNTTMVKTGLTLNSSKYDGDAANITGPPRYFQPIDNQEAWVYSAFFDHMAAQGGKPCVRVQALVNTVFLEHGRFITCHLLYKDGTNTSVVVRARAYPDTHHTKYVPAFMECGLNKDMQPEFVSFTMNFTTPTNRLPVLYPRPRTRNFTVCYAVLHSKFDRVSQIVQSIEINRFFGATHFMVYNYSVSSRTDFVFRHYQKEGLLTVHQWPLPTTKTWYYAQVLAINDCLFRNRNASKFVAVVDTDEIIVPKVHSSWAELVDSYESQKHQEVSSFLFRSTVFGRNSSGDLDLDKLPKELSYTPQEKTTIKRYGLNTMSLMWHNHVYPVRIRSKFIVRPERIYESIIHYPRYFVGKPVTVEVPIDKAMVHHYRWSGDKKPISNTNLVRFKDVLLKRLLYRCGQLPSIYKPLNSTR